MSLLRTQVISIVIVITKKYKLGKFKVKLLSTFKEKFFIHKYTDTWEQNKTICLILIYLLFFNSFWFKIRIRRLIMKEHDMREILNHGFIHCSWS